MPLITLFLSASALISCPQGGTWQLLRAEEGQHLFIAPEAAIATADLDHDGFPELVVQSPGLPTPRLHTLSGADFSLIWDQEAGPPSARGPVLALVSDADGDHVPDVALALPNEGALNKGRVELRSGANGGLLWQVNGIPGHGRFGSSLASVADLDHDGVTDLIVGAPDEANGTLTAAGAAYLVSGANGAVLHAMLGDRARGQFGATVSAVGDLDGDALADVLVGSPGQIGSGVLGQASVWSSRTGQRLMLLSGVNASDRFGDSLAGLGDVDGDGVDDLAVGSPQADPAGFATGTVNLYSGANGALLHSWSGTAAGMEYGAWLCDAGDADGDGFEDLALGAPRASSHGLTENGWIEVRSGATGALLHAVAGTHSDDRLGTRLAPAGDQDGDGRPDLLGLGTRDAGLGIYSGVGGALIRHQPYAYDTHQVGASCANVGDIDGDAVPEYLAGDPYSPEGYGTVELHSGSTGALLFSWIGAWAFEDFGLAMTGGTDMNGDGTPDILISTPGGFAPPGFNGVGYVEVFSGLDGSLIRTLGATTFTPSQFGRAVALLGDNDGDGVDDVLVGSPWETGLTGVVSLFSGANGTLLWEITGTAKYTEFGETLAGLDDIDGDTIPDFAVGAPEDSTTSAGTRAGSVSFLSGSTGATISTLGGPIERGEFGSTLATCSDLDGDGLRDLLVGAPRSGSTGTVYAVSPASGLILWSRHGLWSGGSYGSAIAGFGDVNADGIPDVAAGAHYASAAGGSLSGALEILSGADGAVIHLFSGSHPYDGLGSSVAGLGDLDGDGTEDLMVGAPGWDGPSYSNIGRLETWSFEADHPYLAPTELVAGAEAELTVFGAMGSEVGFCASLTGPGPTWIPQLGLDLDLTPPLIQLGQTTVTPEGVATLSGILPACLAGSMVWLQAVDAAFDVPAKSNPLALPVR